MAAPGRPASMTAELLTRVSDAAFTRTGARPSLPDVRLLGERAAIAGLHRNGPWSCGGSFRTFRTGDGWMGLSLTRPSDLELVPALIGDDAADGWPSVLAWASSVPTAEAAGRARLLGLPCAELRASERAGVLVRPGASRQVRERPMVLDLTALWAGPLCAHLLGLTGAIVVKVESIHRPDGARFGPPDFFELMHHGHRMVSLDPASPSGREQLLRLASNADLVLESSRARALRQWGLVAEELVAAGTSWLSITAQGRSSDAVGFGDDVAVGAGLHVADAAEILPCSDALADPLAGVAAAAAATENLLQDRTALIDVSMHDVAAEAVAGSADPHAVTLTAGEWWVEAAAGNFKVQPPSRSPR